MGSVLSILGGFCVLYVYYANRSNDGASADITHDGITDNTEFDKDNPSGASDQLATQGHRTTRTTQRAASFFHAASHVDASHGIFSDVGRDQHISITTNIDPDPERREFGDWASPLNFKLIQSEIFQTHEAGTGKWLLESKEFTEWRDGQSETLWCRGIPGSGKTVLASIIIDYLLSFFKDRNVAIVYIYCNYKEQMAQTIPNLVASLLKQLVQDHDTAYDNVKSFYKYHRDRRTRPTLDEFRTVIRTEAEKFSKVFVVVDALDECSEVDGSRETFLTVLRSLARNVSLLVTSRDLASIAQDFCGTTRLDIHASDEDIQRYIESRIPREPRLRRHVNGHQTLQEEIVKTIIGNVQGMFLLVRLHIDSLATAISRLKVREALKHLPQDVNGTYDEAMKRIEGQVEGDRKLAERVFSWITYTYRQLSLEELRHALAVSPGMTEMEPDALVDETILMSVCAGLVVIDQESNVVRLVHYTTQEYFENIRASRFPLAQVDITETCITYLSFDVFRKDYCDDDEELESFLESNPLLEYAARYWGHHARGQAEEIINDMICQFLQDYSNFPCVNQVLHVRPRSFLVDRFPRDFVGINVSSFFGLAQTIEYQLQNSASADSEDSDSRTPLTWAAGEGHEAAVKLLLAREDINVNSKDGHRQTPLSFAVEKGHEAMVRLLLARQDVDVNSKDWDCRTPLSLAAEKGYKAVVELLVVRDDVDVNSKDESGRTPLSWAAREGHEATVKFLLAQNNVDVNQTDSSARTPLALAARGGHEAVVKQLLAQSSVDVNSKDDDGDMPLALAAEKGREAVVKLLLGRDDVDVNLKDHYGMTPLSLAAEGGHEAVVNLLLGRDDVDMNSKDNYGQTPLSLAAEKGHEAAVKLLLARDEIDVNPKDYQSKTPLYRAAQKEHEAVVKLLLARDDVDVNLKDDHGITPLSLAAEGGHEAVVKLLLGRDDVDVNSKDDSGRTPLSFAAGKGHEAVVKLLLARDDVEINSDSEESVA